jgi:hypothetical protein
LRRGRLGWDGVCRLPRRGGGQEADWGGGGGGGETGFVYNGS